MKLYEIGQKIKVLREEKKLTQEKLAQNCGLPSLDELQNGEIMQNLKFSKLTKDDIKAVVELINKAYRENNPNSWTSEAHLLSGIRVNEDNINDILEEKNSKIYIAKFEDKIAGTIQAKLEDEDIHIGLFAVHPDFQSFGVGKKLLEFTEQSSMKLYNADKFKMQVISIRTDLIEFYKRRGYEVTNTFLEFPKSELWNFRTNEELRFVVLEKNIKIKSKIV